MLVQRLLLLLLVLFSMPLVASALPVVSSEVREYDFGEILQGDKVGYTFRFRNTGDELLEISSVSSSCGCTAALLSSKRIAPGALGEIKVTFDSGRFRGRVTKTITMKTNAPREPQVQFQLQGVVKELLSISTTRISWSWERADLSGSSTVTIHNQSPQQIILQPARTTSPQLLATLDRLELAPGETAILEVRGSLAPGEKRVNGYVFVATDFKPLAQLRISVSGRLIK